MSTVKLKEDLKVIPDLHTLTMRYEDGGKTEAWSTSTKTVLVRGGATVNEIRAAFEGVSQ